MIKKIFSTIWALIKRSLFMIGLLVSLAYIGAIFYLSKSVDNSIELPESGFVLNFHIDGEIVDYTPSTRNLALGLLNDGPKRYNINHLLKAIDRASKDQRVKSIFINWGSNNSNLSHQTRLNDAFAELNKRRPELPIYFYSNTIDRGALLLSATSERIAVPPVSNFLITGPIMQLAYFGEAAEKLGVGFTVFQTGPHKAVFEPYIRSTPSPEVWAEYQQINQELSTDIISRIAKLRFISENQVTNWFKQSIFTVESALQNNIITDINYIDEFYEKHVSVHSDDSIDALDYFQSSGDIDDQLLANNSAPKLALIEAFGNISHQSRNASSNDNGIFAQDIIDQIDWAKEDDEIAAVVLRIASPGGSALASELIWHKVKKLSEIKPVVVSMGSVAASGGYYIAAAADAIIAESTTITGSIGVTAILPELERLQEKIGIYMHTITDSDRKRLLSIEEKPSPQDIALVNAGIQETYQTFIDRVSNGRALSKEQVTSLAGGRIYTGLTAKELGLVDEIGDTNTAFAKAKKLAGLDPEKLYAIKPYIHEGKNIFNCVLKKGLDNCVTINSLHFSPFKNLDPASNKFLKKSSFSKLLNVLQIVDLESNLPSKVSFLPLATDL